MPQRLDLLRGYRIERLGPWLGGRRLGHQPLAAAILLAGRDFRLCRRRGSASEPGQHGAGHDGCSSGVDNGLARGWWC